MTVSDVVRNRTSCRAFKPDPVDDALLRDIFSTAQQAPSNCNVQPWQVLVASGGKKEQLKHALLESVTSGKGANPDFTWLVPYQGLHRERQFGSAAALYGAMGIERGDKQQRNLAMLRNWSFFDAPHVAIFTMDKYLQMMGAVDLGIYAQTLTLLLAEHGIASCMQGALGQFTTPIRTMFELPEERGVLFGMSFGYADPDAAANQARTDRAGLGEAVRFLG